jgi:prepilin-type N-terminal cleavage/methylation domain-containing protein
MRRWFSCSRDGAGSAISREKGGFTLVEIAIVVLIVGVLAALAISSFVQARNASRAAVCLNTQRQIDSAKELYAVEFKAMNGHAVVWEEIAPYLKNRELSPCPSGGTYNLATIGETCSCSVHTNW